MVPDLAQALIGQLAYEFDVRLITCAGRVLEGALVTITLVWLRMVFRPGRNFVLINEHLTLLNPGIEFG